jgi:hypothetical protein
MRRKSIAERACPINGSGYKFWEKYPLYDEKTGGPVKTTPIPPPRPLDEPDSRAQCYQTVMKTGQTPSPAGFGMTDEYSTPAAWQESNGIGRDKFSFRRGQLTFSAPQDEAAFDRQMCIIVGKRSIEQCMRDSATWRRGETSGAATLRRR